VRIKYLKVTGYRPKSFGIFIWGELNKNYKKKKKFISHKNATATRKGKKAHRTGRQITQRKTLG